MTRARAVEILKSTLAYDSDFAEAKQMAIEALDQVCGNDCEHCEWVTCPKMEQEPTAEYSSDVISRQAAIDAIEPTLKSILQGNSFKAVNVMDKIRDLPSAQPFTAEQIQTMQELEYAQVEKAYELGKADRPKWIPCSKRLPEENEPVLVGIRYKDDFKMVVTARMDVTYWQGLGRDIKGEMRWMPLPEPYKESEE